MHRQSNRDRIASGGKAIYGAPLGILMLEARFPRIPGDMGHAQTWPFPVLYKVIKGASPQRVVKERASGLLNAFLDGAQELVDLGAEGITTNCGFLSIYQAEIARHVRVPVATHTHPTPWVVPCTSPAPPPPAMSGCRSRPRACCRRPSSRACSRRA